MRFLTELKRENGGEISLKLGSLEGSSSVSIKENSPHKSDPVVFSFVHT